jgi:RNA polymerase sigma-70 factor (sigma-E family)
VDAGGDRVAEPERDFAEFYASRFEPNRRMAYALCGDWTEAEELTQHAFVRVYAKWARVARDNAEGYLRTALTRLFLDTRRRGRGRERLVADTPEWSGPDGTTRVEDRQSLPAALQEVSPRQRATLVLRTVQDLSVEQVAEILGCSTGTVRASRHAACVRCARPTGRRWKGVCPMWDDQQALRSAVLAELDTAPPAGGRGSAKSITRLWGGHGLVDHVIADVP